MDKNAPLGGRYTPVAIALHWLIAALIVLNFIAAWVAEGMPKAQSAAVMANHKAIGLTILAASVVRLVWRLMRGSPPFDERLKAWEVAVARVTHWMFYFLMVGLPLSGWALASSARAGQGVSYFGMLDIPALPVAGDKASVGMYHEFHEVFATIMLALFALHVAAALKHQFIDRDTTMARMVPWLKRGVPASAD